MLTKTLHSEIAMTILLNWFPVELAPAEFSLPVVTFPTFQDSTAALKGELRNYSCYRHSDFSGSGAAMVVLVNGPQPPENVERRTFSCFQHDRLAAKLIENSLQAYFRSRKAFTHYHHFSLHAYWPLETFDQACVRLLTGIRMKVHQPQKDSGLGLVPSWEVHAEFTDSLQNEELRKHSIGQSVILKCERDDPRIPTEIAEFRNRYIGHVTAISSSFITVDAKNSKQYKVPTDSLHLEASPATMRHLESRRGVKYPIRKMQELSYVLTKDGRRNSSVLLDRMSAIKRVLSPQETESMFVPLLVYGSGRMILDLRPVAATKEDAA